MVIIGGYVARNMQNIAAICCGVAKLPSTNNERKLQLKNQTRTQTKGKPKALSQQ
jgi:hypothetical protein